MLPFLPPDVPAQSPRGDAVHALVRPYAEAYGGWRQYGQGGDVAYYFGSPEAAQSFIRAVEYRVLPIPRTELVPTASGGGAFVRVWEGAYPPAPIFAVPEGIDPHWEPDSYVEKLPKWFKPGVKVKVKSTPSTRRDGIRASNPMNDDDRYLTPGEIGEVRAEGYEYPDADEQRKAGKPTGRWDYRVMFPRYRTLSTYDLVGYSNVLGDLARVK